MACLAVCACLWRQPFAAPLDHPAAKDCDVLIVGAGIAGLSTAYRLQKAGFSYRILELTPHVGGRVRTPSYPEGVSAEAGLEEFWRDNPTLEIFRELKVPLEQSAAPLSSFRYQGKIVPFTQNSGPEFLKSVLSPQQLRAFKVWDQKTASLAQAIRRQPMDKSLDALKDISFADWVRKRSGLAKDTQELIRIEMEPEIGTSWERISALDGIDEWRIFSTPGMPSFHVAGGNQLGVEAIADAVGRQHIRLNFQVTHIRSGPAGVEVTGTDTGNFQQQAFKASYVVTTVPLYRLLEIQFDPPLSPEIDHAIQSQGWGAYFTAHLLLDRAAAQFWKRRDGSILPILSDGPLGVIYGGNAQDRDLGKPTEILNLLITGDYAEQFNARTASLDQVRDELQKSLETLWPGIGRYVRKWAFYRYHPRAIAAWPVGRSRFDESSNLLRRAYGRVYFAGDFTEGSHSDGAALSAIRVVRDISARQRTQ